jgi:hypothetical protein
MKDAVPALSDNAMIQKAKDYLTRRHVELFDPMNLSLAETHGFYHIKVWHDPDFAFWHQVRFIDKADDTLGWIVEVCYVGGVWKLSARCLPYRLNESV